MNQFLPANSKLNENFLKRVVTVVNLLVTGKLNTSQFSGLNQITVGTTAPSSPNTGDVWIDTN